MTTHIKKPVAFRIVIEGTVDWEAEDSPGAMTPAQEFEAAMLRGRWTDVQHIVHAARNDLRVDIKPDAMRNYPDGLGGYAMPEREDITIVCDCGRTDFDVDGCCEGCGQHASEIGS